jgi:hypothetical protein
MPRFPKRVLALGGVAAGGLAFARKRRAGRSTPPSPSPAPTAPPVAPVAAAPEPAAAPKFDPPVAPAPVTADALVDEETRLAAAEAAGIGGPGPDDAHGDEAFEAVYEAGGGEAEGFELAEEALIENATHGDGRAEPISDAFTPEVESDERTAVDGEADEERVSELGEDDTDRR